MAPKTSNSPRHILISGGGPVGSLLALSLAQRGHTVDVYERRGDMRKTGEDAGRSINLALSDRGWNALDEADVGDRLRERSIPMKGRMVHPLEGEANLQPYSEKGRCIFAVHRTELNKSLITFAEEHANVTFHFGCRTTSVVVAGGEDTKPILHLEKDDGSSFSIKGDAILGADGANSPVRAALMQQVPRFNYSIDWLEHGYKEVFVPPQQGEGDERFRLEKNALHIWPRGNFMLIGLPNLDGSFTGTLFMPFESDGPSFASLQSDDDIRVFFEKQFPDVAAHLGDTAQNFKSHPTSSLGTVRCSPWNAGGKVCLFGDAAHAVVPFYGQGLVAGFEDVHEFMQVIDDDEDWLNAFSRFSDERKPNADGIADLALGNFLEMRDHVADERFLLRKKLEKRAAQLCEDFIPFYSMVTFTHMPYAQAKKWGLEQNAFLDQLLEEEECKKRFLDDDYAELLKAKTESFLWERKSRG
ncbi:MAG: FAD-dependent monooxygenase [Deltaproteobacteria bacterium]|nr:FAD-dependent monooxygenase [Deltaproteobacteria bacterium]